MENQTIEAIDKAEKSETLCTNGLVDLNPIPKIDILDVADFGDHVDPQNHVLDNLVKDFDDEA